VIYKQAAEEVRWLESKGLRAGAMVQRADLLMRTVRWCVATTATSTSWSMSGEWVWALIVARSV